MDNEENLYMYTLVEFIIRGRRSLMKKIDIVPTLWVDYNSQTKKFFTRFLSPPYTSENVNNLHNIIKNCDYPLSEWHLYSVVLKGRAKTYEEALEKLARLEKEEHVFSLESDNNDTLAEVKFENVVKQNKLKNQAEDLKKKLAVRKLGSTSCSQEHFEEPLTSDEDKTYKIKDQNKRKNLRKRNVSVTNLSENIQKKPKLFHNSLKENKLEKASTSRNQNKF